MSLIFGEDRLTSLSGSRVLRQESAELSDPSDSASVELTSTNSPEWETWETLKALREQAKRRGRRTRKYRTAALKFKRALAQKTQMADELTMRYLNSLERTEMLVRRVGALENDLESAQAKLEAHERQPLPELSKAAECVICLENARGVAFVPCGHIACCAVCAKELQRLAGDSGFARCPICREEVTRAQPLYFA